MPIFVHENISESRARLLAAREHAAKLMDSECVALLDRCLRDLAELDNKLLSAYPEIAAAESRKQP